MKTELIVLAILTAMLICWKIGYWEGSQPIKLEVLTNGQVIQCLQKMPQ